MSHRILVADDSLTVQKVVSITLASHDYELIEIRDETQLNEELMKGNNHLLLLDLNLSENKSGYQIAKDVRVKSPKIPIILLLGTFDTVDESAFDAAQINDRIVKPFESSIFTQKVQALIEDNDLEDGSLNETIFSSETESDFLNSGVEDITPVSKEESPSGEDWVVDSPAPVDKSSEDWDSFSENKIEERSNPLEASLEGWGMSVPGQIGKRDTGLEMAVPGVIQKSIAEPKEERVLDIVHEEEKLPDESDLDYPDVEEMSIEQSVSSEIDLEPTSALTSSDNFDLDVSDSKPDLASAIEEEESADDFWATDDVADSQELAPSLEDQIEEESDDGDYFAEPDQDQIIEEVSQASISLEPIGEPRGYEPLDLQMDPVKPLRSDSVSVNTDEIVEKIIAELKPTLNELVEKHCKETIENVAWQIIPDLAENLIRNEIKEIKDKSL